MDRMAANTNDPLGLEVNVVEVHDAPGHWLVEAIDHGSEGEVYRATFDACDAEARARAYAAILALPKPEESETDDAHINSELVGMIRASAKRVFGGNCTFADDDLARLERAATPKPEGSEAEKVYKLEAEIDKLRSAIKWAMGFDEGDPQFPGPEVIIAGRVAAFGWRQELRRRAHVDYCPDAEAVEGEGKT